MKFILFALNLILSFLVIEANSECFEEYTKHIKVPPQSCCDFPDISEEKLKIYDNECEGSCDDSSICCKFDCFYVQVMKLYEDGKFIEEKLIELFFEGRDEKYQEIWKNVIEKSLEKCKNLMSTLPDDQDLCKTPNFVAYVSACVIQENFLTCPTFNSTDECNVVVNYLKNNPCGLLNEEKRVVDFSFWMDLK